MEKHDDNSLLKSRLSNKGTSSPTRPASPQRMHISQDGDEVSTPSYQTEQRASSFEKPGKKAKAKKKGLLKKKRQSAPEVDSANLDAEDLDELLNAQSEQATVMRAKTTIHKNRALRVLQVFLIILCVYVAFLVYGVIETNYIYNQEGLVEPEILSVADRAALSEYENLSGYYLRARILYERTLSLDYELSLNPDASLSVAMDYNAMLDDVAKLTVDIDAAQFGTEYSSIKSQLLNWVKTDIAVYLQNISAAITNNDGEKANNAMVSRDVMYADFATLTSNMAVLCKSTAGAKNGDIFNWSPESYVATLSGSN